MMKSHLKLIFGVAIVAVLTLASGIIHGRMTDRWGPAPDTVIAAEKLARFPEEFGDWKLQSKEELGDDTTKMLECVESVCGLYVNRVTGDVVSLMVILGPPGPIAVHTPEICVSSRDYTAQGRRSPITIQDQTAPITRFGH